MIQSLSEIPITPTDTVRVNVALDRELYQKARDLHIDVHTLFRMKLREAVDVLDREPEYGDVSCQAEFLADCLENRK